MNDIIITIVAFGITGVGVFLLCLYDNKRIKKLERKRKCGLGGNQNI